MKNPFNTILHKLIVAAVALTLSACSTMGNRTSPAADAGANLPPVAPAAPAATATPAPSAPTTAKRSGGYYLDDGPGDNAPANLDAIPDATPRVEPLHRAAARPYIVMGRTYVPMAAVEPYRARGVASWYGRRYHGKLTSNGESYDMYGMSAAHPTLPLPSYVRITSVANGRSVVVRVNDRGPFIDSRLIDLSYTAAHKLGIVSGGSALVDVELIVPGAASSRVAAAPPSTTMAAATTAVANVPAAPAAVERQIPLAADSSGVYVQLAAFGSKENAEAYASRVRADVAWLAPQLQVIPREGLFRVRAGPYPNQDDARQTADRISQSMGIKPVVNIK